MAKSITTPKGKAKFIQIGRPDDDGKYNIAISLDKTTPEFAKLLQTYAEAEKDFGKAYRGKELAKLDKEKNEAGEAVENGRALINFTASKFKPDLFDAKRKQITDPEFDIGWGSEIKVSFILKEYDIGGKKGLSKYIKGIQVINLVNSGTTAESCGFEEEEGYTAPEPVEVEEVNWNE